MAARVRVEWHTRLEHPYVRISGCTEADKEELRHSGHFEAMDGNAFYAPMTKVLYFRGGRWFPGYYMATSAHSKCFVVQRCYGKPYRRFRKMTQANRRKTDRVPDHHVLVCRDQEAESLELTIGFVAPEVAPPSPRESGGQAVSVLETAAQAERGWLPEPPNAYTLYMLEDMLRMGRRLHDKESFYDWLEVRYLAPSRRPGVPEWFSIPPLAGGDDAMRMLQEFRVRWPEYYSSVESALAEE